MMKVEIIRYKDDGIETIGDLFLQDDNGATIYKCVTLELPYKDNQHKISCIPCGTYSCKKEPPNEHFKSGYIWITNVPNRDQICIHKGVTYHDILGCVILGKSYADFNNDREPDLVDTVDAFTEFYNQVPDEFKLVISNSNDSNV